MDDCSKVLSFMQTVYKCVPPPPLPFFFREQTLLNWLPIHTCVTSQAVAVAEATLKHSKDQLATEKKNQKTQQKAYDEDKGLLEAKKGEVEEKRGAYVTLQEQSKAAEKAIHVAQQRFQAVTAGLSSNADGQEETLAAQKIGKDVLKV